MGFSRQEDRSGLPSPSPGDLPNLGLPHCRQTLAHGSHQGSLDPGVKAGPEQEAAQGAPRVEAGSILRAQKHPGRQHCSAPCSCGRRPRRSVAAPGGGEASDEGRDRSCASRKHTQFALRSLSNTGGHAVWNCVQLLRTIFTGQSH